MACLVSDGCRIYSAFRFLDGLPARSSNRRCERAWRDEVKRPNASGLTVDYVQSGILMLARRFGKSILISNSNIAKILMTSKRKTTHRLPSEFPNWFQNSKLTVTLAFFFVLEIYVQKDNREPRLNISKRGTFCY
jgi:hypothetical protein